jgi:hypothetical protein
VTTPSFEFGAIVGTVARMAGWSAAVMTRALVTVGEWEPVPCDGVLGF